MAEGKGLLDFISSPAGQGLLAAGFGALAGRGTRAQAIGQGGLAGLLAYGQAQGNQADMARQKTQDAWVQTQRDWMSQDRARQEADRAKREAFMSDAFAPKPMMQQSAAPDPKNDYTNPDFLFQAGKSATTPISGMGSIPMGVRPVDPMAALRSGFGVDEAMQLEKLTKPRAPNLQTFKPGEIVRNMDTGQVVFQAPEKASPTELTRMVQEMNALPPNDPMRNVYAQAIRKQTTHAPGTNVNLAVNTEKSLLNTMAQGLGNQLDNSLAGARSAVNTINTAARIRGLVGSGQVIVGPGADYRVTLARIGDALGVAGKDNAEKLANTASLVQGLAQSELEAAQGMKGQGQITEAEREILRRAASGNFNMSAPELISLSNAMEKVGQSRIKSHQAQVQRLNSLPGAAPLVPFYSVEAPQEAAAPAPTGANDLAAAARAELERRRKGQ